MRSDMLAIPSGNGCESEASEMELKGWVESTFGASIATWTQISGGNRCRSWLIRLSGQVDGPDKIYLRYQPPRAHSAEPYTVWREALIYRAVEATNVCAPKLLAVHDIHQAIVTTAADGRADYRRLSDAAQKTAIAHEFVEALAHLHACPISELPIGRLSAPSTIADCVRAEIAIWRAMYEETDRRDPLVELALNWLVANVPIPKDAPVLVHGDAGPGNFLFQGQHMTGLVDWELAHPGDPFEDLAWFCMRSVMEPVPDFAGALRHYETVSGRSIDHARLQYHRVFVSARVVIIRHRNVTGLPGNSIVSRSLNRRLLVDALAAAEGVYLPPTEPIATTANERTAYYEGIVEDLKRLSEGQAPAVADFAKNTAKVLKYLCQYDSFGREVERRSLHHIGALLGQDVTDLHAARQKLAHAIATDQIGFEPALQTISALVAMDAQLAAPSSGSMAKRGFPATTQEN